MRLNTFVPRLVVLAAVWLLATATLTLAAGHRMSTSTATPATPAATTTTAAPKVLVVPNVASQAYVFAKGILEDSGFGWKVSGGAPGFPGNVVVGQSPPAGTPVIDTGAPRIILTLRKSGAQTGLPDASSPFAATAIKLVDRAVARKTTVKPAVKPAAKPVVKPAAKPAVKPAAKPVVKPAAKPAATPKIRKPDFVVPGVKPEPQNELSLPDRAKALDRWLSKKPRPSDANVARWLYQHSWIVTGAGYGWWHGAEALQILITADQRAQSVWGIGARSEKLARTALAEVEASAH